MSYVRKRHLGHLVMRVRDIDRSVDFYTRVMGLTIMERSRQRDGVHVCQH